MFILIFLVLFFKKVYFIKTNNITDPTFLNKMKKTNSNQLKHYPHQLIKPKPDSFTEPVIE